MCLVVPAECAYTIRIADPQPAESRCQSLRVLGDVSERCTGDSVGALAHDFGTAVDALAVAEDPAYEKGAFLHRAQHLPSIPRRDPRTRSAGSPGLSPLAFGLVDRDQVLEFVRVN